MKRKMQLTILVMSAVLVVSTVNAESYWSLGSYSLKSNADRERDRIAERTGLAVEVVSSGDLYRVVVEKDADPELQKSTIEDIGISPWTLSGDDVEPVVESESMESESLATRYHLVLASFLDETSAEMLMERLVQDGIDGTSVVAAEVKGVTFYRLVQGPFADRSSVDADFSAYGIVDTWWAQTSEPALEMRDEGEPASAIAVVEEADTSPEPEPVYTISPPGAGESYVSYCLRRANKMERAVYCKNGDFNRIANAERRNKRGNTWLTYCALHATAKERKEKCQDKRG